MSGTTMIAQMLMSLSGHSKIDKTKVLKINCNLMKVESIAECSLRAFCNISDLHNM